MNKTISYLTFLIGFISFFPSLTALYQQRWKVKQHTALLSSVRDEFSGKKNTKIYRIDIPLGEGYQTVSCDFRPIFQSSIFFTKTYDVPFSLNIEKPPKNFPAPFVTKDSAASDGELKGDILRATTCWSQGFNAAGATSDIMMFAGNVKWRKSIFDTTGAPWQNVVDALLSNTSERSKTVTLVFEREVAEEDDDSSAKDDAVANDKI